MRNNLDSFEMTLSLNILNHLGLNLYSNVPSVLSEAVANAWDADAATVDIKVFKSGKKIVICDDGQGMNVNDANQKFLHVGYRRRDEGEKITPKYKRPVMGRKGIGKLSLFSIAKTIEVYSAKRGKKIAFRMVLDEIKDAIKTGTGSYKPKSIGVGTCPVPLRKGTCIVLTDLKKRLDGTHSDLRRRLARRFSIIGKEHKFAINIDGKAVTASDRDYFGKIQFMWIYGKQSSSYVSLCNHLQQSQERPNTIEGNFSISGWIGTVSESGQLKDPILKENLNKIVIMVRGKLAQEDILEEFSEGGLYSAYLMGEIHADFLDDDDKEDIATTSRQRVIEDDPRYQALKNFIYTELKHIQNNWSDLRDIEGSRKAMEISAISEWFKTLGKDSQKSAKALFGKIGRLTLDDESERKDLLKHAVLAFETLRAKENLDALDRVDAKDLGAFVNIFRDIDDIEATFYHQIVKVRVGVINALREKVDANARERVLQQHLYDHLWLLDPSWERVEATEYMEQKVATEFGKITAKLTSKEKSGRVDIKYRTTSGKHLIIELKRAGRTVTTYELQKQGDKYRGALTKILRDMNRSNEPVEVIFVVGKSPQDWGNDADEREKSVNSMAAKNMRVVLYPELIENATKAYGDYLKKSKEAGRILSLIQQIES